MKYSIALLLALSACVKIEDGPSKTATADSTTPADTSPIADPTLRPREGDPDFLPPQRRAPLLSTAELATDTVRQLSEVDTSVSARPTASDLEIVRAELIVPVAGVTVAGLRDSYDELRGGTRQHEALDILAPRGTAVLSATRGRVLKLFNSKAGGLMVYAADSAERFILMYGHLDSYAPGLAEGSVLTRGQVIGTVGTTGNAPAGTPHLHFAVARTTNVKEWYRGVPVNPYPLLTGR